MSKLNQINKQEKKEREKEQEKKNSKCKASFARRDHHLLFHHHPFPVSPSPPFLFFLYYSLQVVLINK